MKNIEIIIPIDTIEDMERVRNYYVEVLLFRLEDELLIPPVGFSTAALRVLVFSEKKPEPGARQFLIFTFFLEKNFLSYCETIRRNGALMDMALSHPGGYYAEISDPVGNKFAIECLSFEEDDTTIDLTSRPSYFKY